MDLLSKLVKEYVYAQIKLPYETNDLLLGLINNHKPQLKDVPYRGDTWRVFLEEFNFITGSFLKEYTTLRVRFEDIIKTYKEGDRSSIKCSDLVLVKKLCDDCDWPYLRGADLKLDLFLELADKYKTGTKWQYHRAEALRCILKDYNSVANTDLSYETSKRKFRHFMRAIDNGQGSYIECKHPQLFKRYSQVFRKHNTLTLDICGIDG